MTAEQLKTVNLILAEHEYLTKKVPLLEQEIIDLNALSIELEKLNSKQSITINEQQASIKKLKKSNKVKNNLIIGTSSGFIVSLLLLICGL